MILENLTEEQYRLLNHRLKTKYESNFPFLYGYSEKDLKDEFIKDYLEGYETKRFYKLFPNLKELEFYTDLFINHLEEKRIEKLLESLEYDCKNLYIEDISNEEVLFLINAFRKQQEKIKKLESK